VLACDLPFLDAATLQQLIAARDPRRLATAFRSSHDDKPEPLCTIYEPASLSAMEAWVAAGQHCPRGFLAQAEAALLRLRTVRALDNINTPAEYSVARALLRGDGEDRSTPRGVQVQYFALLREQAGRSAEKVSTRARDARELYEELRIARGLTLRPEQLRVAINEEFAEWSQALVEGDSVVFLPPVAGG
jgi:molybdopterin-guanine dinucleotide biosynthesis protein A